MTIDLTASARLLSTADHILILTHAKPDGDTLGCAFALLWALESLGKQAQVRCADPVPAKYGFIAPGYEPPTFEPELVVAVDTADLRLLGDLGERYGDRIDLCIDHHKSNLLYAKHTLLEITAAAGEIVYRVIRALGVTPDGRMANALFTAITTDTGGFRYADVTANTHRIAADLIELGAEHARINRLIFETKSRGRIDIDRLMLETIEFHFDGYCALIVVPHDIKERYSVTEDDLDGISSMPRTIEGVYAGLTLRETAECDGYRVSLRSQSPVDAAAVCGGLGGGGHANAAGATVHGALADVKRLVLEEVKRELERKQVWMAS